MWMNYKTWNNTIWYFLFSSITIHRIMGKWKWLELIIKQCGAVLATKGEKEEKKDF